MSDVKISELKVVGNLMKKFYWKLRWWFRNNCYSFIIDEIFSIPIKFFFVLNIPSVKWRTRRAGDCAVLSLCGRMYSVLLYPAISHLTAHELGNTLSWFYSKNSPQSLPIAPPIYLIWNRTGPVCITVWKKIVTVYLIDEIHERLSFGFELKFLSGNY